MDATNAAVISVASVAVQRALQVIDPVIDCIVDMANGWWPKYAITKSDFKNAVMAMTALVMGVLLSELCNIRVLEATGNSGHDFGDVIVSALVLGAGAEGANSVVKTLQAIKQERQAAVDGISVSIATPELLVAPGTKVTLRAFVANSAVQEVVWSAVEAGVGIHDDEVTLPTSPGIYHIVATSVVNPAKAATAKITVQKAVPAPP